MTTAETLIHLKKNASSRTQNTLDAIYEVCNEECKNKTYNFSIPHLARVGAKRGVPKAQSLRNKSAEKYQALIQAFIDERPQNRITSTSKSLSKEEEWIEEIKNPKHKLLVQIMASELRSAKTAIKEIIPPNLNINVHDHKSEYTKSIKLDARERNALEYLLSFEFQKKWSLRQTELGEYIDENGKTIFKVKTIDALKKALDQMK